MSTSRLMGAVCTCVVSLFSLPTYATSVPGQGTWETTLQGRDLDGNLSTFEAYYDTVLGITWLADANYAQTSGYVPYLGVMDWSAANNWAAGLTIGSVTGWRLPMVSPIDGATADDANFSIDGTEDQGYNISAPGTLYAGSTANEMAHLFYNTLGNLSYYHPTSGGNQPGYGLSNTGPFSNFKSAFYWSATEYSLPYDTNTIECSFSQDYPYCSAWNFRFNDGSQFILEKTDLFNALVVHNGDVGTPILAAVPVPAAVWLFCSGLLGLMGLGRQRRH